MAQTNVQVFSGNVGIGTTNPGAPLEIYTPTTGSSSTLILKRDVSSYGGSDDGAAIEFKTRFTGNSTTYGQVRLRGVDDNLDDSGEGGFAFDTLQDQVYYERMRIKYNGNVGIGTTNPSLALHVHGSSTNQSSAPDNSSNSGLIVLRNTKTGTTPYSMSLGVDQTTGIGFLNAAGNSIHQPICINTRGGNVGIGTTNPIAALDIVGGAANDTTPALSIGGGIHPCSDLYVLNSLDTETGVGFGAKVIGVNIKNKVETNNTLQIRRNDGGLTSAGAIYLGTDDRDQGIFGVLGGDGSAGTTLSEFLTIRSTGKVGIGTTNPADMLNVYAGNIRITQTTDSNGYLQMYRKDTSGGPSMIFRNPDGSVQGWFGFGSSSTNDIRMVSSTSDSDVSFWTNNTRRMTIDASTGNVGIGTENPGAKLDVNGSMQSYSGRHVKTVPVRHNGYNDIAGNGGYIRIGEQVVGGSAGYSGSFCAFSWFGTSSIHNFSADRWITPNRIRVCFRWGFVAGYVEYVTFKIWETYYGSGDSLKATITSYNGSLSRGLTTVWGPDMSMIYGDVPGIKIEADSTTASNGAATIRISDIWLEYVRV